MVAATSAVAWTTLAAMTRVVAAEGKPLGPRVPLDVQHSALDLGTPGVPLGRSGHEGGGDIGHGVGRRAGGEGVEHGVGGGTGAGADLEDPYRPIGAQGRNRIGHQVVGRLGHRGVPVQVLGRALIPAGEEQIERFGLAGQHHSRGPDHNDRPDRSRCRDPGGGPAGRWPPNRGPGLGRHGDRWRQRGWRAAAGTARSPSDRRAGRWPRRRGPAPTDPGHRPGAGSRRSRRRSPRSGPTRRPDRGRPRDRQGHR